LRTLRLSVFTARVAKFSQGAQRNKKNLILLPTTSVAKELPSPTNHTEAEPAEALPQK
jgi:hypothetical protein